MPQRLDAREAGFPRAFASLLGLKREIAEDVDETVKAIIAAVVERGDDALVEYTRRFDALDLTADRLRVGEAEIEAALAACDDGLLAPLRLARDRIEAYHRPQKPENRLSTDAARGHARLALDGARLGRALRARRHGQLSVLRPDERRPGQGRRRRRASSWSCRRRAASSIRSSSRPPGSPESTRSTGSAARRPSRRSPTAPPPSRRWPRSSDRATPMWRRPSGASSGRSAST